MTKQTRDRSETDRAREPQSYGSERDWVSGRVDQEVGGTQSKTSRHDEAFYQERHQSEESPGDQGGKISEFQLHDGTDRPVGTSTATDAPDQPGWKVAENSSGRSSYWRKRDYE